MGREKRVNVLVVYDQSERSYQWSLSIFTLRVIFGGVVAAILLSLTAAVLAWVLIGQNHRLAELSAENQRLTVYSLEINQLKEELNLHRDFTRRICELIGVKFPDSSFGTIAEMALPALPPELLDSTVSPGRPVRSMMQLVSEAPLPSQLEADADNLPRGVPMRGRASRGYNPDQQNLSLRHFGLDIAGREGSPVFVTAAGVVEFVGWDEALGNMITVDHQNGYKTIYGHNSVVMCKQGDRVKFGDIICLSGNTGVSSAPHLHYEIRLRDQPVDPLWFVLADSTAKNPKQTTAQ